MSPKSFPKKWSNSEEKQLLKEFSEKINIKIISKNHERSENAILARFKKITSKEKIDYSSDSADDNDNIYIKKIMKDIQFLKIKNKELEKSIMNIQIMFNAFSIDCANKFSDLESSIENVDSKF